VRVSAAGECTGGWRSASFRDSAEADGARRAAWSEVNRARCASGLPECVPGTALLRIPRRAPTPPLPTFLPIHYSPPLPYPLLPLLPSVTCRSSILLIIRRPSTLHTLLPHLHSPPPPPPHHPTPLFTTTPPPITSSQYIPRSLSPPSITLPSLPLPPNPFPPPPSFYFMYSHHPSFTATRFYSLFPHSSCLPPGSRHGDVICSFKPALRLEQLDAIQIRPAGCGSSSHARPIRLTAIAGRQQQIDNGRAQKAPYRTD